MSEQNVHKLTLSEYKSLFDSLYTALCLFANKYVNNLDVSQDIVQDVFIRIWENQIPFQNENTIKSFLYTAVKNQSLDYLRSKYYKATQHYPSEEMEKMETETFFLREVVISETTIIMEKAVNTLPKRCAQIIKLSLKEYSNSEIAKELSISINTVKAQKRIAFQKLRPLLRKSFILIAYIINS